MHEELFLQIYASLARKVTEIPTKSHLAIHAENVYIFPENNSA